MQTQNVRRAFLRYFQKQGHTLVPSSPVVPHEDPTLLFINAGMNQFKDLFLGKAKRDYTRATSSQKCIRVGGKHNDLENVGHTKRHLTFFEMLGNFSFGDYFKKQAIRFAWDVSTDIFGFDPEKLYPSVFEEDDEAFELWLDYVPAERISRMGKADNYWEMGETGPCGPCSEIYYDRGESFGSYTKPEQNPDGERFLEFWNLVFMQQNRDLQGTLSPLPNPSIDTGAGLERVVMLQMGVDSLFETDLLRSVIAEIEQVSGVPYDMAHEHLGPAFRVVADHLRTLSFAIADGVQPSNTDRGYVLRKVLRRAVRYGKNLGFEKPFLGKIFPRLVALMSDDFPELKLRQNVIEEILQIEEESFFRTLQRGGNLIRDVMERSEKEKLISGEDAFKLKDTYGFPLEEILLLAKDAHFTVDLPTYETLEEEAKMRSRQGQKKAAQLVEKAIFEDLKKSQFCGYDSCQESGKVVALVKEGQRVNSLSEGDEGLVILDRTPFYAEMGGQVGDTGILQGDANFDVIDCQAPFTGIIAHVGKVKSGKITVGDEMQASVNTKRRQEIANNHTATHLLHWALQEVLGDHVKQAGSVVEPTRLRFDFSHHKALTPKEIHAIEQLINEKVCEDRKLKAYEIPYKEASKDGQIKQFFGEKYGDTVRVIDLDYSKELCGGTHTSHVGTIGPFKIAKEGSIASGVRRIEAFTGKRALDLLYQPEKVLDEIATLLKVPKERALERFKQLLDEKKELQNSLNDLEQAQLKNLSEELLSQKTPLGPHNLICQKLSLSAEAMRSLADLLAQKEPNLVLLLISDQKTPAPLLVRLGDSAVKAGLKAGDLIKTVAPALDATGGGRPNSAQGAAKAPEGFNKAVDLLKGALKS